MVQHYRRRTESESPRNNQQFALLNRGYSPSQQDGFPFDNSTSTDSSSPSHCLEDRRRTASLNLASNEYELLTKGSAMSDSERLLADNDVGDWNGGINHYENANGVTRNGRRRTTADGDEDVDAAETLSVISTARKTPLRAWVAIAILLVVNLLNYMDRYTIAGVLSQIQEFFEIGDADGGLLQAAFICAYMVFAPICGYLGDRYNRKWIMVVGLILWSAAVVASTFVPSNHFWLFVALRGFVGIGEASYATVAPTLIADYFSKELRSYMLMIFYFAVPFGSGLGYVVGANVSVLLGSWQWGVRVTPLFGIVCLLLIVFVLYEPERGQADEEDAGVAPTHLEPTSFVDDLRHLIRNRTYVWTTLGFASSTFVIGSLALWTPTTVEYGIRMSGEEPNISQVSFTFGGITAIGGILGVSLGSFWAQQWRRSNPRADPMVCGIGALGSVPFLFCAIIVIHNNLTAGWIFMFVVVTLMSLNWAVVVDITLYVVIPTRRSSATAVQILVSHVLGDAFSPYLVGMVSDLIRGDGVSPAAHFHGLQYSLFIPNFVQAFGGFFYLGASWYIQADRQIAENAIKHLATEVKVTQASGQIAPVRDGNDSSARLLDRAPPDEDDEVFNRVEEMSSGDDDAAVVMHL